MYKNIKYLNKKIKTFFLYIIKIKNIILLES